jgi:hypothetical protein
MFFKALLSCNNFNNFVISIIRDEETYYKFVLRNKYLTLISKSEVKKYIKDHPGVRLFRLI